MSANEKHIILIGFKHTGKSTIGCLLAQKLNKPWVDLDHHIEKNYHQESQKKLSCREIVKQQGEAFFRDYETKTLEAALHFSPSVISLGGGTVYRIKNQDLIKPHFLIHITADPSIVYQRIMKNGKPAYFPDEQDPKKFFDLLWQKNEVICKKLRNISILNFATYRSDAGCFHERLEVLIPEIAKMTSN